MAINQMAIHAAMDLYNIQDKRSCFEKVVMVARAVLREQNSGNKAQK